MSWNQGVAEPQELPESLVKYLENKYLEMYKEEAKLQYITWFGVRWSDEFIADFGTDKSIKVSLLS